MTISRPIFSALALLGVMLVATRADAQVPPTNSPPPGAYQPIPNYTGTNAGLQFRTAINDRFSGTQPISPKIANLPYANLPREQDGLLIYCIDCREQSPCASGGDGAWAAGAHGQWQCIPRAAIASLLGDVTGAPDNNVVNTVSGGHSPIYDGKSGNTLGDLAAGSGSGNAQYFNLNGAADLRSPMYKASGSLATCSGTVAAASNTLTVSGCTPANDFAAGQGIEVAAAGPSNTAAAPTGLGASGACTSTAAATLGNSMACSGGTTYTYVLAPADVNRAIGAATASFTCAGMPTLDEADTCVLSWTAGANDVGMLVYRDNLLIAFVPAADGTFIDEGNGALSGFQPDLPAAPPASPIPGPLVTTIDAIGGNSITLHAAAVNGASVQNVFHDDTAAFNAALIALGNGNRLECPRGDYPVTGISYTGLSGKGIHFEGHEGTARQTNGSSIGCHLVYVGNPGGAVFHGNGVNGSVIEQVQFEANARAQFGLWLDNSDCTHPSSMTLVRDSIVTWPAGQNEAAIAFGNAGAGANCEVSEVSVSHTKVVAYGNPNLYGAGMKLETAGNTKNFRFSDDEFDGFRYGLYLADSGAIQVDRPTFSNIGGTTANPGYDIWSHGGQLTVIGAESESDPKLGERFVYSASGNNPLQTTLIGNSWQGTALADDYIIKVGGALTMIGNRFSDLRAAGATPKVADGEGPSDMIDNATAANFGTGGVVSIGNWYANASGYAPIYDSGGNQVIALTASFPFATTGVAPGAISMLDTGGFNGAMQALTTVFGWTGNRVGDKDWVNSQTVNGTSSVGGLIDSGSAALVSANLINDSEITAPYWTDGSAGQIAISAGAGHAGGNALTYTGTGVPAGNGVYTSQTINLPAGAGTLTLKAYLDGTNTSVRPAQWIIANPALTQTYAVSSNQTPGTAGVFIATWNVTPGVTQVAVAFALNNTTVANGQALIASNPQLSVTASSYYTQTVGPVTSTVMDSAHLSTMRTQTVPVAFSALPACNAGAAGTWQTISDSTAVASEGQACAGGSTNYAAAFCNGSGWKCF